jgi:hypothetical protein
MADTVSLMDMNAMAMRQKRDVYLMDRLPAGRSAV